MNRRAAAVLAALLSGCHYSYDTSHEATQLQPVDDGARILGVEYVRQTRKDTRDDDASPETLEEHSVLHVLDGTGRPILRRDLDGVRRVTWVGRWAGNDVIVGVGDKGWLARAYDATGAQAWEVSLREGALEPVVGASSRNTKPTAALIEGDHLRIVRLFEETLVLDGQGQLSTRPPLTKPVGLDLSPVGQAASLSPLPDGGAVLFGRPADDPRNERTLVARYNADGALAWQTTLPLRARLAQLRSDGRLALTGFAGDEFTSEDQRLVVLDLDGTPMLDAAIARPQQQLSELMVALPDGALALYGPGVLHDAQAQHWRALILDARGAVVSESDAGLPYMIQHGYAPDGRMAYCDVERPTAAVGQLPPAVLPK